MSASPQYLSKSGYIAGLQCPKLLWYEHNRKAEMNRNSPVMQLVFDEGKKVGKHAQQLFPGGILIERMLSPEAQDRQSREALSSRKPLYEAGFIYQGAYALADILDPAGSDEWDLYEVKSSTSIDESHFHDVAFQKYVYEGAGLKIRKCFLVHLNREYVRKGDIDLKQLFVVTDVTETVASLGSDIETHVKYLLEVISGKEAPSADIGPRCSKPHECPLDDVCWKILNEKGNIFTLYSGGRKCYELLENGITKVADIPDTFELNEKQTIQLSSVRGNEVFINKKKLKKFLSKLKYPLYFLDFETVSPAIPMFEHTSPYEAIPFQYSLFVVEKEGAEPKHYTYLAPGDVDPRPEVLKQLKDKLGDKGSLIAYWAAFETMCLRKASIAFPEFGKWFSEIEKRFVDLFEPFKSFSYYNPKQEGSLSLKSVLPALTKMNYEGLEISEGGNASARYFRMTFYPGTSETEKQKVREALIKYCDIDTKGMIEILKVLEKAAK